MKPSSRSAIIFYAGASAATAYLGVWQTKRYFWKRDLVEENEKKFSMPMEEMKTTDPKRWAELDGRRVHFEGYYDHEREVLLGPRSAPTPGSQARGLATNPQGYFVYTPLMPKSGNGSVIFVNRGWVPRDHALNTAMPFERPNWASVTGVVQKLEKPNLFSPENEPYTGKLMWLNGRDLVIASNSKIDTGTLYKSGFEQNTVNKALDTEPEDPIVVEEIATSEDEETYPKARGASFADTNYVTPETHLAYAFTWFALSLVAGMISFSTVKQRRKLLLKQMRRQGKL